MERTQTILRNIHEDIVKGIYNDLQIVCEDGTVTGSRIALAALSPYFRIMLTADMIESRTCILNLPSVSLSVFQDIIKMCLCGVNLVNEENCMQVLDAAEMMQVDYVKDFCYSQLKKGLPVTSENCLNWWRLMTRYNFDVSEQSVTKYLPNFLDSNPVNPLSKKELLEIISSDDLKREEVDVVRVVMKWIKKNKPLPDDVTCLFEKLKLIIVDTDFLVNEVLASDIAVENVTVNQMIQDVLLLPKPQVTSNLNSSRFFSKHGADIFVLLHKGNSLLSCFTADDTWQDIQPAPDNPGLFHSAASLGDKIYITGGSKKPRCTLIYDIREDVWEVGPHLEHNRFKHCMATVNSKLYAIAGECINTIEELSEGEDWQVVGDLTHKRENAVAVTFGDNILVMGGRFEDRPSSVIQCFNTKTQTESIYRSRLPFKSNALRGSVHCKDLFLLDIEGNVMRFQMTGRDGKFRIQIISTAKWVSFVWSYGVVHRKENLICFSKNCNRTFNLFKNREETNSLPKPPRNGYVYGILSVFNQ